MIVGKNKMDIVAPTTLNVYEVKKYSENSLHQHLAHAMTEMEEIRVELDQGKYFKASVECADAITVLTRILNGCIEKANLDATPQDIMDVSINNAKIRRYYEQQGN